MARLSYIGHESTICSTFDKRDVCVCVLVCLNVHVWLDCVCLYHYQYNLNVEHIAKRPANRTKPLRGKTELNKATTITKSAHAAFFRLHPGLVTTVRAAICASASTFPATAIQFASLWVLRRADRSSIQQPFIIRKSGKMCGTNVAGNAFNHLALLRSFYSFHSFAFALHQNSRYLLYMVGTRKSTFFSTFSPSGVLACVCVYVDSFTDCFFFSAHLAPLITLPVVNGTSAHKSGSSR